MKAMIRVVAMVLASSLAASALDAQATRGTQARSARAASPGANQLMRRFGEAWTRDDTASLRTMFADDVDLLENPMRRGHDAVVAWMREQTAGTGRLEITPLQSGGNADTVYQSGRWRLAVDKATATGVHTFVFTKQSDGSWKIISMYILEDPKTPKQAR